MIGGINGEIGGLAEVGLEEIGKRNGGGIGGGNRD